MNNKAFTFIEVVITTIILAVLAAIAIPSYQFQLERMRAQEAVVILTALYDTQKERALQNNGAYYSFAVPTAPFITGSASSNFNFQFLAQVPDGCGDNGLALADSIAAGYTLYVTSSGRIKCQISAPLDCAPAICRRIGF